MERDCNKCVNHTSGTCSSWECKMQTVEDVKKEAREKALEEFAEKLKDSLDTNHDDLTDTDREGYKWLTIETAKIHIDETLSGMKGGEVQCVQDAT